jgi:hypothetical protein
MKHFHNLRRYTVTGLLVAVLIIIGCSKSEAPAPAAHGPETSPQPGTTAPQPAPVQEASSSPDLPDPGIPGFHFPESELTLNNWVFSGNNPEIYKHAWGIWTALTLESGKTIGGELLRVFETWKTPNEIIQEMDGQAAVDVHKRRLKLMKPHQFRNKQKSAPKTAEAAASLPDTSIHVSVAYNPAAADHAASNKLFYVSTLKTFLKDGYTEIPNFPLTSVTIKPVYKLIQKSNLQNGLYSFPVWTGPPAQLQAYDEDIWPDVVFVDINNGGKGNGSTAKKGSPPTPETTYNLTDFIYNSITAADVDYLEKELNIKGAQPGDYVILVAMHTTTREMKRWAWQTFWWSANPSAPFSPSSSTIASFQPAQLQGAPRHYAMSVAYQMLVPAQPLTGGQNKGTPLFAYNPYLEAGFDPSVFQVKRPIDTPSGPVTTEYGVQTNCMSCHGLAQYVTTPGYYNDPNNRQRPYAADFYLDLNDPIFKGNLQVDFAWSIIGFMELNK